MIYLNEVVVNPIKPGLERMENALMASMLQTIVWINMIDRENIRSYG